MLQSESFAGPPGWVLCEHFVVPCVPPYRLDLTVAVLRRTSLNPVDVLDTHGSYLRAFAGPKGLRVCVAHQLPDTNILHIALYLPDNERKAPNEELRVRIPQMLGTGVNLSGFYTERPHRWTVFPRKAIALAPSSRLQATIGRGRCEVNSLHKQAVDAIGEGLTVVARDDRGVVQGIENAAHRFWIGVQWHPEYLPQVPEQRRLFAALVEAARAV